MQYLATGDYSEPVVIQSHREAATTLSIQMVPFGVEEKLLMSRDITRLEAVARVRRDFIANVSHELKTPLTVLTGFLETLAEIDVDERKRKRYLALAGELHFQVVIQSSMPAHCACLRVDWWRRNRR